uniref:PROP1-like PPR domain-containing protein n=1 Tax=Alexandrium catenella TaxID=2925 RepID=A0A7S1LAT0_ALECA
MLLAAPLLLEVAVVWLRPDGSRWRASQADGWLHQAFAGHMLHGVRRGSRDVGVRRTAALPPREFERRCNKLNELAEDGRVKDAEEVYMKMEKHVPLSKARFVLNTVLKACANAADEKRARYWYEDMIERNIEPNIKTFGKLMETANKAKNLSAVEEWYQISLGYNFEKDPVQATIMIDTLAHLGLVDRAEEQFRAMREASIEPTQQTFGSLILGTAKKGMLEEAAGYFRAMRASGIAPVTFHYNSLLLACANSEPPRPDAAEVIFNKMSQDSDVYPDAATLSILPQAIGHAESRRLCKDNGIFQEVAESIFSSKMDVDQQESHFVMQKELRELKLKKRRFESEGAQATSAWSRG